VRNLLRHRNITTAARQANFDASPVNQVFNTVGDMLTATLEGQAGTTIVPLARGLETS